MDISARGFGSGDAGLSQTTIIVVIVFLSISFYNVIELNAIIWGTFKRYTGLYFWSFIFATWGIAICSIGFITKYFSSPSLGYMCATFISVGWVSMVSGQSMVLFSRLHLVLRNQKKLRMVLWMIIIDGIICHTAIIPMIYGSFSPNPDMWKKPYSIMEKIQVTIFFIQEIVLSSFYIIETVKLMRLEQTMGNRNSSRRLRQHLILINIVIIILDITILGLEYANFYEIQTAYKAFVYSTKLKLEFTILNRLIEMTTQSNKDNSSGTRTQNHTTNTKGGMTLSTFIGPDDDNDCKGDSSYQAYAMGNNNRSASSPTPNDNGVTLTTEIVVHRERHDNDMGSLARLSSADESTIGVVKGESRSKSSSEINLATRGF